MPAREAKRIRVATRPAVAESKGPQLINLDPVAVFVLNRTEESTGGRVKRMDAGIPFAEVPTSSAPLKIPQLAAAMTTPQGELSGPLLIPKVRSRTPFRC